MKKLNLLSMLLSVAVVVSLIVVSACTKEGPPGKDGKDGEDGINGQDGTATCAVCHDNSENVEVKIAQWGKSLHAIGGHNFENRTTCAPCHTSQGFKEVVGTANTATAAAIEDPANINCYTCHKIHDSYTAADWALRKTGDHTFWLTGETFNLGTGSICASCHQPRTSYVIPDASNPDGTYKITNARFGPHYGSQGSTLTGSAYYLVGTGYSNSSHVNIPNACVTCHMTSAIGYTSGGHSFNIFDEAEQAYNVNGCVDCHTAEEAEELIEEAHLEIGALIEELGTLLQTAGIYNPAGTSGTAIPGDYTNKLAGAYWNYKSVTEDRSMGVHNPKFVKRILENSIASLQ